MEVGKDGECSDKKTNEMTSGVAEKCLCLGVVKWNESDEGSGDQKSEGGNQVVPWENRVNREDDCANSAEARAKSVHVVVEVECVHQGKEPEKRDDVAECRVWDEERDSRAGSGDNRYD